MDDTRPASTSDPEPIVAASPDGSGGATEAAPAQVGPFRCARHPQTETYLRCGRCERPICPRCMIQTPVGARCRECAQLRRLPMYEVGWGNYLRGTVAALVVGYGGALLLQLVEGRVPFANLLTALLMAGLGYVVGEATTRAARRKRGTGLGLIAATAAVLGIILGRFSWFALGGAHPLIALGVALGSLFLPIWGLIGVVLAAIVAFSRLR